MDFHWTRDKNGRNNVTYVQVNNHEYARKHTLWSGHVCIECEEIIVFIWTQKITLTNRLWFSERFFDLSLMHFSVSCGLRLLVGLELHWNKLKKSLLFRYNRNFNSTEKQIEIWKISTVNINDDFQLLCNRSISNRIFHSLNSWVFQSIQTKKCVNVFGSFFASDQLIFFAAQS